MSPALRIIEGLQFSPSPAEMARALRNVIAIYNPNARAAAYSAAGLNFDDMPMARYVDLDQDAMHMEIERRIGAAA